MNTVLISLHRVKTREGLAHKNDRGMPPRGHLGVLNEGEAAIFRRAVGGEQFLDDDDLIRHLAEIGDEIAVRRRLMNLVAQFGERGLGQLLPLRRAEGEQGRLVAGAEKFKFGGHGYLSLMVAAGTGGGGGRVDTASSMRGAIFRLETSVVLSPRFFLMLSMPRVTGPRLLQ